MKASPGITDPTRTITIPYQYDDNLLKQVSDEIQQIVLRSGTSDTIHININSIGGSLSSAHALSQLFATLPTPIATWGRGIVGGDALLLLASGTKERILQNGTTILASLPAPLPNGLYLGHGLVETWATDELDVFHCDLEDEPDVKTVRSAYGACVNLGSELWCFDSPTRVPLTDRIVLQLLAAYSAALGARTSITAEGWFELATHEHFINPLQCVDLGLVDRIA